MIIHITGYSPFNHDATAMSDWPHIHARDVGKFSNPGGTAVMWWA